jgi:hypothetical protein
LAQSEYKKRHDIFAKIIHMNLAVKFNLLKNTQPHYSYTPESCLENDSYKLYFDRTILTDIHIKHNRPDIIILNKQQKQAYHYYYYYYYYLVCWLTGCTPKQKPTVNSVIQCNSSKSDCVPVTGNAQLNL